MLTLAGGLSVARVGRNGYGTAGPERYTNTGHRVRLSCGTPGDDGLGGCASAPDVGDLWQW